VSVNGQARHDEVGQAEPSKPTTFCGLRGLSPSDRCGIEAAIDMLIVGGATAGFFEIGTFRFDAAAGVLGWSRVTFRRHVSGRIAFADIRNLSVQRTSDKYRLAIITSSGEPIPFTTSYSQGDKPRCEQLKDEIEALLKSAHVALR
jgi:hypothetical protein